MSYTIYSKNSVDFSVGKLLKSSLNMRYMFVSVAVISAFA